MRALRWIDRNALGVCLIMWAAVMCFVLIFALFQLAKSGASCR